MRIGNWMPSNNEQPNIKANNSDTGIVESSGESEESLQSETTLQHQPTRVATDRAANIDEIIKAFQLPDTPATRALIGEMVRGGIELSSENINILSQAAEAFTELKPEQVVFMAREGITINTANVERFQQFLEHKNLIGEQLASVLEQLPEQIEQPKIAGETLNANQPNKNLEQAETIKTSAETPKENVSVNTREEASLPIKNEVPDELPKDSATLEIPEKMATSGKNTIISGEINSETPKDSAVIRPPDAKVLLETPKGTTELPEEMADTKVAERTTKESIDVETLPKAALEAPEKESAVILKEMPKGAAMPQNAEIPDDTQVAKEAPVSLETPKNVINKASIPLEVPEQQVLVSEEPVTVEQKIVSLFKKVDPQNLHKLPKELNARELVRELAEVVETVKQKLPELEPHQRETLSKAVSELEQSVKFLDNLNKFTPIINIPLQWGDKRTTAELYVFNDAKSGKKIDPQNATIFMSLMTENAGRVETMIKVLGKNVECDFSLESDEVAETIRGGMHTLYKLLDVQGYKLARTSAKTSEKAADIFDVSKVREQNKSRYFFDRKV